MQKLTKYKYLYTFLSVLALIGFISGYIYYSIQPETIKESTIQTINIKEELSSPFNNIKKRTATTLKTFINGIFIIPQIKNIFNIFYTPFQIGFIFNILKNYSIALSSIYILIYFIIPFAFTFVLTRISLTISYNIIRAIILKNKKYYKEIKKLIKKYLLISLILLICEVIITIFSSNINDYLMTFL